MKRLLLTAALCIHTHSYADVMYKWVGVSDGKPADVAMTLLFPDDVVAQGKLSYRVEPGAAVPASGVKFLQFSVATIYPMTYEQADTSPSHDLWHLNLAVAFNAAGMLTGRIFANDQNSDFTMASDGTGLFTFSAIHSDQDWFGTSITCNSPASCTSSGRLVRVVGAPHSEMPEPSSLALIALGTLSMLGLGRFVRR